MLYQPGNSIVHHLHPLTKLVFSLVSAVIIFSGVAGWISIILPGLLALLILRQAGLLRQGLQIMFRIMAVLGAVLFLIHGLFNPDNQVVLIRVGSIALGKEGILYAGLIFARLGAFLAASLTMMMTTPPSHLTLALEQAGLPHGIAYLLGSPLFMLPQFAARIQTIQTAQQARGLETSGKINQRLLALFPLAAPLVFRALMDVEERAMFLELRGFNTPTLKTYLIELVDTTHQRNARWIMLAFAFVSVFVRLFR